MAENAANSAPETPEPSQQSALAPIILAWQLNASTGWGLYGLHLAMQLKRLGRRVYLTGPPDLQHVPRPWHALLPQPNDPVPNETERCIVVSALGNNFAAPPALEFPNPVYHVGLTVFEDTGLLPEHIEHLKAYDRLIAPSRWCASILAAHGIPDVPVCQQGYDHTTFHPAPRVRSRIGEPGWDGRILVFSGGKLEYRKGQDIAIAAFRLFRETPEGKRAVLVTAWHNPWPATMDGIWNAGHVKGVPKVSRGTMELTPWLAANGIPPEAHIDLGQLTQQDAAQAIRECDVAIFPNRCEGATNMVLSECLGMGLPCHFGSWTGQRDLLTGDWGGAAYDGGYDAPAIKPARNYRGTDGWRDVNAGRVAECLIDFARLRWTNGHAPPAWEQASQRFSDLLTIPALALVP